MKHEQDYEYMLKDLADKQLILTEEESRVIANVFKRMVKNGIVIADEFEAKCKYCGRDIIMKDFGYGWKPYSTKIPSKIHKCRAGKLAYKEMKSNRIKVSDLMN